MNPVLKIRLIVWGGFALLLVAFVVIGWRQWYITVPTALVIVASYGYLYWVIAKAKASRQ